MKTFEEFLVEAGEFPPLPPKPPEPTPPKTPYAQFRDGYRKTKLGINKEFGPNTPLGDAMKVGKFALNQVKKAFTTKNPTVNVSKVGNLEGAPKAHNKPLR